MLSTAVLLVVSGCSGDDPVAAPSVRDASATTEAAPSGASATPADTATQPAPSEPAPVAPPTAIDLATYQFDMEATAGPDDELSRDNDIAESWAVDPCQPTDYPTDAARAQFAAAIVGPGDQVSFTQLAQYPDEATASEVLAGFSRALDSCGRLAEPEPVVGSDVTQWQLFDPAPLGQESLTFQSTTYIDEFGLPGGAFVVVRIGAMVLLVATDDLYAGTLTDAERVAAVTELATAEVARLEAALAMS